MTCASFEDLKWCFAVETSRGCIDVYVEQGNYEVCIRGIDLEFVSTIIPSRNSM
jgi:hypothetical protein